MPTRAFVAGLVVAILVCAFTHAGAVILINSPSGNSLKGRFEPLLNRYSGPWLYQNWSLFAPAVAEYNNELFVRGKASSGHMTPWLNVSQYYIHRGRNNLIYREHYVSEAVAHALDFAFAPKPADRLASRIILFNAAAQILCLYSSNEFPKQMQLEIDRAFVASITPEKPQAHTVENKMLGWHAVSCERPRAY